MNLYRALCCGRYDGQQRRIYQERTSTFSLFQARYGSRFTTPELMAAVGKLNATLLKSWSGNQQELDTFRQYLVSALWREGKTYPFYLTKAYIKVGDSLPFYGSGRPQNVSESLWSSLPETPIVRSDRRFQTCSIVGSSGILLGSGCGHEIDKAEFVIRFNVATVSGFKADVGRKTNLTTLNPTYVRNRFGSLQSKANIKAFKAKMEQFRGQGSLLMLPAFGISGFQKISLRVAETLSGGDLMTPVYGDPRHFLAVKSLWQPILNTRKLPTTGLYLLTAAFEFCEHINLFGAWPFEKSPANRNVSYHYHDNVTQSTKHNFHGEFWYMLKMHNSGIIKLQYSDCL
ncbi:CMP-N-acetylneuraminate-poly-alpha-2,8-sialyltransferase-like [Patiria miniata]|uniref:Uncharacterized protein n=1 Tax=Patiria miniata TaxID=46514 RepID=A0A914B1H5_PATMI|nr:CMP-N-acetylneuraminate-poly-alpha-2,8-sialyltransferase-like [Patiria miniata]